MKKRLLILLCILLLSPAAFAYSGSNLFKLGIFHNDVREIKSLLNSQIRYANRANFSKFISTYDKDYVNADGFNLETYSNLVKDVWSTYDNIVYDIKIKDIEVKEDSAVVNLLETSSANISLCSNMDGVLKSEANSVYYLKKNPDGWKVASDKVLSEFTSMLYGDAIGLKINLSAPKEIKAGEEYTASLEFIPPKNTIAVASIASDKVEYPQNQPEEVFRKLPEDNILERLFTSNKDNLNEYVVASIGLTKAELDDLCVKLSLTGFGYKIIRVNVIPQTSEAENAKD